MISINRHRVIILLFLCALVTVGGATAFAQDASQSSRAEARKDEDTNLDVQLYLVLASNREVEDTKLPVVLDPVIKRLRDALPFKHYNLAGTFLNRVKNNGHLDVSWVGGPFAIHGSPAQSNPSFSQFAAVVRLATNESGQEIVRLSDFKFGTRVPIVTGQAVPTTTSLSAAPFPTVNYEPIGLRTDLSMREGSTVIAGTLNVGPSGDAIVIVVSSKRAN